MNETYFKPQGILKAPKELAYQSWLKHIQERFKVYQEAPTARNAIKLEGALKRCSRLREIKHKDKREMLKYFIDKIKSDWSFLQQSRDTILSIMKLLKTSSIKDYRVDWKTLLKDIESTLPEVSSSDKNMLTEYIGIIRPYFDENNAVEVYQYFEHLSRNNQGIGSNMKFFLDLTKRSKPEVVMNYLQKIAIWKTLGKKNSAKQIKKLIKCWKLLPDVVPLQRINKLLIVELGFSKTESLNLAFVSVIGKENPSSKELLEACFKIIAQNIRPFETEEGRLKYIANFFQILANRMHKENKIKAKIEQLSKQEENQEEDEDEDETDVANQSDEEEQKKISNEMNGDKQMEEEQQEEQEEEQKLDKLDKLAKLNKKLRNCLNEELLGIIRTNLDTLFDKIFFVNSKTLLNKLGFIYEISPKLATRSLDLLDKLDEFPHLSQDNQAGLSLRLEAVAIHIFATDTFLDDSLRILERVGRMRHVINCAKVIKYISTKIPLVDEADSISEEVKIQFTNKYKLDHDRFYFDYSEKVFELFRRLIEEGVHTEHQEAHSLQHSLRRIIANSHKCYKKRLWQLIRNQLCENLSPFILTFIYLYHEQQSTIVSIVKQKYEQITGESKEILKIKELLAMILFKNEPIDHFKKQVRMFAKHNRYYFLASYAANQLQFFIKPEAPLSTSLAYLHENPNIKFIQYPSFQACIKKAEALQNYMMELISELKDRVQEVPFDLEGKEINEIINEIYSCENAGEINRRQSINELLALIRNISHFLQHQYIKYTNEQTPLQFVKFKRVELLQDDVFVGIVRRICRTSVFIHDSTILNTLANLLEGETLYAYSSNMRTVKKFLKGEKNQKGLRGQINQVDYCSIQTHKVRMLIASKLYCQKSRDVTVSEQFSDQMKIILMGHHVNKLSSVFTVLLKTNRNERLQQFGEFLRKLYSAVDNPSRFYWIRVHELLNYFYQSGFQMSPATINSIMSSLAVLVHHSQQQIQEYAIKSLKRIYKLQSSFHVGNLKSMPFLYMFCIIKNLNHPTNDFQTLSQYASNLQPLLLSETRTIRIVSLCLYAQCLKRIKQIHTEYKQVECKQPYEPTTVSLFLEKGFKREGHCNKMKRAGEYFTYREKSSKNNATFKDYLSKSFSFLASEENSMKFIKNFHLDMAASIDQLRTAVTLKVDIGRLCAIYMSKIKSKMLTHSFEMEPLEMGFGQHFFVFLLRVDAEFNNLIFFKRTKEYVKECLTNMESLDNRNLLKVYLRGILSAYSKHYLIIEDKKEIDEFVFCILSESMHKASGAFFDSLIPIIKLIDEPKVKQVIEQFTLQYISKKSKVARAGQIYVAVNDNSYSACIRILHCILDDKVELESNFLDNLLKKILSIPRQLYLQKQDTVVNIDTALKQGQIGLLVGDIYLVHLPQFSSYLVSALRALSNKEKNILRIVEGIIGMEDNVIFKTAHYNNLTLQLVDLSFDVIEKQALIQTDGFATTLGVTLSKRYEDSTFYVALVEQVLKRVLKSENLSSGKKMDFFRAITQSFFNFVSLFEQVFQDLVANLCKFEEITMNYKELMLSLCDLFAKRSLNKSFLKSGKVSGTQLVLLMQSIMLSEVPLKNQLDEEMFKAIMTGGNMERKKMWCKEMLRLRGKSEYLGQEGLWKQIKQHSNPYFYHA